MGMIGGECKVKQDPDLSKRNIALTEEMTRSFAGGGDSCRVFRMKRGSFTPGWKANQREPGLWHLALVSKGQLEYSFAPSTRTNLTVGRGEFLVLPPPHGHAIRSGVGTDACMLRIHAPRVKQTARILHGLGRDKNGALRACLDSVWNIFRFRSRNSLSPSPPGTGHGELVHGLEDHAIRHLFLEAAWLLRELSIPPMDPRLGDVVRFLEVNTDREVTREELAERSGLSTRYLTRIFKEHFGVGPRAFHRRLRLEGASQSLEEGETPLDVIAEKTGWADLASFSKAFRNQFGRSPSRHREHFRRQNRG